MASKHNEKRAARIAAKGVHVGHLATAQTSYLYYADGGATCCLCDTPIKYLFRLSFTVDGTSRTFSPVGSTCIGDWFRAMPLSPAQEAALANLALAKKDADKARAQIRARKRVSQKLGADSWEFEVLTRYWGSTSDEVKDHPVLSDIAGKVERYGSFASERQFEFFSTTLRDLLAPSCPRCGKAMRFREPRNGATWSPFWGCTGYPKCRGSINVGEEPKEEPPAPAATPKPEPTLYEDLPW